MKIRPEVQAVVNKWLAEIKHNLKENRIRVDRDQIFCFERVLANELERFLLTDPNFSTWQNSIQQRNPAVGRLGRMAWAATPDHCQMLKNAFAASRLKPDLIQKSRVFYIDPNHVSIHIPFENSMEEIYIGQ